MYAATMETGQAATETALFSNLDETRTAKPVGYPQDETTPDNHDVAKLNAKDGGKKIGPSLVLRVMAGDTIQIGARAFYKSTGPKNNKSVSPEDMVASLLQVFGGTTASSSSHAARQAENLSPFRNFNSNDYQHLKEKDADQNQQDKPKAYLNFALFDDQFNLVDQNSGVRQVKGEPDELQTLAVDRMPIEKSGFLYVYTSNETAQDVFFDNVMVQDISGPLLEETHYYPFGLTMAGISSNSLGPIKNKFKFNGGNELQTDEFAVGSGLELYDAVNRMYDAQIARFHQIDPMADLSLSLSEYAFSSNNPINRNDPLGLKDTTINGVTGHLLNEVVVTAHRSDLPDRQTSFGRFWRRYASHFSGVSTNVSNLKQLGMNSMLRRNMVWLTGQLLERVKNDPAMVRHQQRIVALIQADPRYRKLQFVYSNRGQVVEFGGDRAAGEDWFGLSDDNPLLHEETWDVAGNPLTWTLRHATVQTDAIVKEDGTIILNHYVNDKLDLRPGPGHTPAYNKITTVLGGAYHDVLRGSDKLQVRGFWSDQIH